MIDKSLVKGNDGISEVAQKKAEEKCFLSAFNVHFNVQLYMFYDKAEIRLNIAFIAISLFLFLRNR